MTQLARSSHFNLGQDKNHKMDTSNKLAYPDMAYSSLNDRDLGPMMIDTSYDNIVQD